MNENLKLAGVLSRVIAKAIDFILIVAVIELIPKAGFYIGFLYLLVCDGFFERRSIGKRLLGLQVKSLREETSSPIKDSILRNSTLALGLLLWKIPLMGWVLLPGIFSIEFIIMIGNDKRMRIGDEIAQTTVLEIEEAKGV